MSLVDEERDMRNRNVDFKNIFKTLFLHTILNPNQIKITTINSDRNHYLLYFSLVFCFYD